jgi:uncharacterized OB-fold protein
MIVDTPLPAVTDESAPFWEATSKHELRIQRCLSCGRLRFPPRPACPWCRSWEFEWSLVSGRGRIWSYVVPHPPLLPAFEAMAPYNVVVVELEEDATIRLVGNLLESPDGALNDVDPSTIEIGEAVRVVFQDAGEGIVLPRWVRA